MKRILSLHAFFIFAALFVYAEKVGRCRNNIITPAECSGSSECQTDGDCSGINKCCSNGCINTCQPPLKSMCDIKRESVESQVRVLDPEDAASITLPRCDGTTGLFEEVQCNSSNICWCVNPENGIEKPDTRTPKGEKIDCKNGRGKCLGPTCRMFCEYGFSLDDQGCQMCKCFTPCQDVKCSGSTECQVKSINCASGKCPVASCREARSLNSLCPLGSPLLSEGGDTPLLCGLESYKPQCPIPEYKCNVQDQNDYGVCCPFTRKLGQCPAALKIDSKDCDSESSCSSDMDCTGDQKCCSVENCGSICANPVNNSVCMQQKEVAEHRGDSNFIPKCSDDGEFYRKQCNKKNTICWCVSNRGAVIKNTMKSGDKVECSEKSDLVDKPEPRDSSPRRQSKNPCKIGLPLKDSKTGEEIFCGRGSSRQDCPNTYTCEIHPADQYAVCCATSKTIAKTKLGKCPDLIPEPRICPRKRNGTCVSDSHCPDTLHCCPSMICGSLCTDPEKDSTSTDNYNPSTCEYLRDLKRIAGSSPAGRSLATHTPRCDKDGIYEPIQCSSDDCWCVTDHGIEIKNSRSKNSNNFDCRKAREMPLCGIQCRKRCDYGFKTDESGCDICECRDPCQNAKCGEESVCIGRSIKCTAGNCPPVATCEPKKSSAPRSCPQGSTPLIYNNEAIITCDNNLLKCPDSYKCVGNTPMALGVCCSESAGVVKDGQCPATGRSAADLCVESCQSDSDCGGPQKCCENSCGGHVCSDPIGVTKKPGQCPYLVSQTETSCDFECSSDFKCTGDEKCCSNGCGTTCMKPKMMTACEHSQEIAEHRVRSRNRNRLRVAIPSCDDSGDYNPAQCDALGRKCWCVNNYGEEVPGTRVGPGQEVRCDSPSTCPTLNCNLDCKSGFAIGRKGCPVCKCKDQCQNVVCGSGEECRMVKVQCIKAPCPPVALCLPKLENPCKFGEPLKEANSDNFMTCRPKKCPSSYVCNISPFDEYSVCCPKPKSTCEQQVEIGFCKSAMKRWYFDSGSNLCKQFIYGGCGGNLNNFNSEDDCKKTCPTMSSCQITSRKSRRLRNFQSSRVFFQPRCQAKSGGWNNIQCLDSFGLCWCVNRKGIQIPGTLGRGQPKCSTRGGRKLEDTPICSEGESVNICKETHCEGLVCKANAEAVCRINPCGSCKAEFYNDNGQKVDCEAGLTNCLKEEQSVLNHHRYRIQTGVLPSSFDGNITGPFNIRHKTNSLSNARVPAYMTISPPQCRADGSYEPVQRQNDLSWCVDEEGEPKQATLSRGDIKCDKQGKLARQDNDEPVCGGSRIPARVCHAACLNALCPSYPDAICVSDACNNCKTHFVDSEGNTLQCEFKCHQPIADGDCSEKQLRYYFDAASKSCEMFTYTGCNGNANNFETMESCQSECTKPLPVCEQPVEIGNCRMSEPRWFYNKLSQQCEEFTYGGCGQNDNNFLTKKSCEARCPDNVICPQKQIGNDEQFGSCSREEKCSRATCKVPDSVCSVDPCTCEKHFVNLKGEKIACLSDDTASEDYIINETKCKLEQKEQFENGSLSQVDCDKDGNFMPIQCEAGGANEVMCWCVDEAGVQITASKRFPKGKDKCDFVPVDRVEVILMFAHDSKVSEKHLKNLDNMIGKLIKAMQAETENGISTNSDKKSTKLSFTLIGKNKVNAAYHLQKLIEKKTLYFNYDQPIVSDYSKSKFRHLHASTSPLKEKDSADDNNTVYAAVFSILVIVVIIIAVAIFILYKKRRRAYAPQQDSTSLAFSSPVYGMTTDNSSSQKSSLKEDP